MRFLPKTSLLAFVALAASAAPSSAALDTFHISVLDPGVYGVTFEDLRAAGLAGPVPSARLTLSQGGRAVALWVEDGGDGRFGPGDRLEFVGDRLAGEGSYFNTWTDRNVYVLSWGEEPLRFRAETGSPTPGSAGPLLARRHHERDLLLLRFPGADLERFDSWFWARLTHVDPAPFKLDLDLSDLDPASSEPLRLTVVLRGLSKPSRPVVGFPDHAVELRLDGNLIASSSWIDGRDDHRLSAEVPAGVLKPGNSELTLSVPRRTPPGGTDPVVDVVVLNWIEVVYPQSPRIAAAQVQVERPEAAGDRPAVFSAPLGQTLTAYTAAGARVAGAATAAGEVLTVPDAAAGPSMWVVSGGRLKAPVAIEADTPSHWKDTKNQADYIVITHPSLAAPLEPLIALRRRQGLKVAVVDIRDVYDEWNHGLIHPKAIRDFLSYAYFEWQKPRPRFVLLVGDASWDGRTLPEEATYADATYSPAHGTQIATIDSIPYAPAARSRTRNLIPTWRYGTFDGHAAGDNWFVAIEGKDERPNLAIGRFPVTEPDEVSAIVEKTLRYEAAGSPPPRAAGDPPAEVLWITNEDRHFQQWSDELADWLGTRGLTSQKLYPSPGGKTEEEQQELLDALNRGQLLVHFMGHGGRFIWRTGPPDWTQHRDLFGLADIDKLTPRDRLPVILSMTCYSAPFDHPKADSIGEKFLRTPSRGAVAVVAASWRNAPYKATSEVLLREMTRPGATLGEALQAAKQQVRDIEFVKQYNLLGDPALRLALPPSVETEAVAAAR